MKKTLLAVWFAMCVIACVASLRADPPCEADTDSKLDSPMPACSSQTPLAPGAAQCNYSAGRPGGAGTPPKCLNAAGGVVPWDILAVYTPNWKCVTVQIQNNRTVCVDLLAMTANNGPQPVMVACYDYVVCLGNFNGVTYTCTAGANKTFEVNAKTEVGCVVGDPQPL